MKNPCEKIRNAVAELGPRALRGDEEAQEHVAACAGCYAFLEAAAELDTELEALEPLDAPDELVAALLERVEGDLGEEGADGGHRGRSALSGFLSRVAELAGAPGSGMRQAVAVGLFVVVMSGILVVALPDRARRPSEPLDAVGYVAVEVAPPGDAPSTTPGELPSRDADQNEQEPVLENLPSSRPAPPPRSEMEGVGRDDSFSDVEEQFGSRRLELGADKSQMRESVAKPRAKRVPVSALPRTLEESGVAGGEADRLLAQALFDDREAKGGSKQIPATDALFPLVDVDDLVVGIPDPSDQIAQADELKNVRKKDESRLSGRTGELEGAVLNEEIVVSSEAPVAMENASVGASVPMDPQTQARWAARDYLQQFRRIEDLSFQEASGYWSNTYVPGDPLLRLLEARLSAWERSPLERFGTAPLRLHDASRRPVQPFDPPQEAALAVYLSADRAALEEEGRTIVQVGLQATERRGGRRGAMNLALVLDLRGPIDLQAASGMRALAGAFAAARDVGDRFHLVVAGRPGGLSVEPDNFRHGPLTVTLDELFGSQSAVGVDSGFQEPSTLGLVEATRVALEAVARGDDPSAPLGSSVVVLVTAGPLGDTVPALEKLAHTSAVSGVPLSVVGVGERVVPQELDRLALAGQGSRRLLARPADAEQLAQSELQTVSRVVARAVRLRIRLAPGVKLVDVLGSRRLDDVAAERVREAEQSIDLRLARNLGIAADRGEDEEGVQIVIPSFLAGDSHVFLLDVVAPGPGPVADVTVRYKDLVYLRNGVAKAQLALERGASTRGPLEINVVENVLAWKLYGSLEEAGLELARGEVQAAADTLASVRRLLEGMTLELRQLDRQRGLGRDLEMLDQYLALLGAELDSSGRLHLAESLRLAGRLKVLPRPVTLGGGG